MRPIGGGDDTAIAIGLLLEALHAFYAAFVVPIEFLVPLDRAEVGGG